MKGSREIRRTMAILRSLHGKPNGVIPCWALDRPWMWVQASKDKRLAVRRKYRATDFH